MINVKVVKLSKSVEDVAIRILESEKFVRSTIGKYEADVEAYNLILISAKHALAACKLARSDISFEPSASVLSRSCIELGAKALWLLDPDDCYVREARWVTHMRHGVRARRKTHSLMKSSGLPDNISTVHEFTENVASMLPVSAIPPKQLPNLRDMLKSTGHEKKYLMYVRSSQDIHGSHVATQVVQQHLGTHKINGNFSTPGDWSLTLANCWQFTVLPSLKLADRVGIESKKFAPLKVQESYFSAQHELRNEVLSR